jgi:hypothetical protein
MVVLLVGLGLVFWLLAGVLWVAFFLRLGLRFEERSGKTVEETEAVEGIMSARETVTT